jgi:CheY-like chemotaxis protein
MDNCPRCGGTATLAGYEDARTFHQCEKCKRVWTTMVGAPPARTGRPRVQVLVVDDSDQLVALVALWLADEGYAVLTATTGREALDLAGVHHPEIVLLDLIMPHPDGFDVCEELRRQPQPPEVILMTGISDPLRLHRAADLGVVALLRKPLTAESVVDAVATAEKLRRTRLRTANHTGR